MRKMREMSMLWVILICMQLDLALKMFVHVCSGLLPIFARRHVQVRLMGNFSMKGEIPQLVEANGALCFTCKEDNKTLCHFFFDCPTFNPKRMTT